jgi:hypothetical protein
MSVGEWRCQGVGVWGCAEGWVSVAQSIKKNTTPQNPHVAQLVLRGTQVQQLHV